MGQTVLGIWINNAGYGYVTSGRYELLPIPCQNVTMMFYYVEQEPVEDSYWAFNMSYTLDALAQYDPVELLPHSQHIGKLIAVNPSLCVGCLLCQLACSFNENGSFNPSQAHIKIDWSPMNTFIEFDSSCTECGTCTNYCFYDCLTRKEGES